jgi:hypothetical protein
VPVQHPLRWCRQLEDNAATQTAQGSMSELCDLLIDAVAIDIADIRFS